MTARFLFPGLLVGAGLLLHACKDNGGGTKQDAAASDMQAGTGGATGTGGSGTGGSTGIDGSTGTGGTAGTAGTTAGSGGSAGTGGGGSGGTAGGTGGQPGSGGTGTGGTGGVACPMDCSVRGLICCAGKCVNQGNDILNCGGCGTKCMGTAPYCDNGRCGTPPCAGGTACGAQETCCGNQCCKTGTICCVVPVGPAAGPACVTPDNGSCPAGCPNCPCASPNTAIATPDGERPIAELRVGDLVYSVERGRKVVVPVKAVNRTPVVGHVVLRIRFENGSSLEISPKHPTADGRTLSDLAAGHFLAGIRVLSVQPVTYSHPFTYDILPASETGSYFAGGVLIGSTLAPSHKRSNSRD